MVWGYKYFLNHDVYRWAKPGFIATAAIFVGFGIPTYIFDGWDAGHAVSYPLLAVDVLLVLLAIAATAKKSSS
jgi:hypothetical protein